MERVIDVKTSTIKVSKEKLDRAKELTSKRDEEIKFLCNELGRVKDENVKIGNTKDELQEKLEEVENKLKCEKNLYEESIENQNIMTDEVDIKHESKTLKNNALECNTYLKIKENWVHKSENKVQYGANKYMKLHDSVRLNNTHHVCLVSSIEEEKKAWKIKNLDATKEECQNNADNVTCSD